MNAPSRIVPVDVVVDWGGVGDWIDDSIPVLLA